jgi:hypothetical protein
MRGLSAGVRGHFRRNGNAKRTYDTERGARRAASKNERFTYYRCDFCGKWHVGNKG